MTLININKTDNNYQSNWINSYNDEIFILGNINPFTYKAESTDLETGKISWYILSDENINLLKSKL